MPGNMAVQKPSARIVRLERNGQEASRWEHGDVTARWVIVPEERGTGGLVPWGRLLCENHKVTPVKVDGMVPVLKVNYERVLNGKTEILTRQIFHLRRARDTQSQYRTPLHNTVSMQELEDSRYSTNLR